MQILANNFIKIPLLLIFPWFDFQDILVSEGLLEEIGQLLHHHGSSSVIITHSCKIIADLCSSCMCQQVSKAAVHVFMACVSVCSACMACLCMVPTILYIKPPDSHVESHDCYLGCDAKSVFIKPPPGPSVSHPVRWDLAACDVILTSPDVLESPGHSFVFICSVLNIVVDYLLLYWSLYMNYYIIFIILHYLSPFQICLSLTCLQQQHQNTTRQMQNPQLSYNNVAIISKLDMTSNFMCKYYLLV